MKILITGFGPFGGMKTNPSQVIVEQLSQINFTGNYPIELISNILPVDFRESALKMKELILQNSPDLIISFGVDLGKKNIELETKAALIEKYIDSDYLTTTKDLLPASYITNFAVELIYHELKRENHRVIISDDSGGYVCNHIYYLANVFSVENSINPKILFVHIPYPYPYMYNLEKVNPDFTIAEIYETAATLITKIIQNNIINKNENTF